MRILKIALILLLPAIFFYPSVINAEKDPTEAPGYYPKEYINMKNPLPFDLSTLREGRKIYTGHCEICHGILGDGKGDAAVIGKFNPMPRDFTNNKVMSKKNDGMLYYSISKGVHGTRMFSREDIMLPNQRWAVIHYIRTFATPQSKEK